jgi:hypothetical protein
MALSTSYKIYIGSADNIICTGSLGENQPPNLYVEIRSGESAVQRTKAIKRTQAALAWDQEFIINGNSSSIVSLSVKHHNWPAGGDICIGRVDTTLGTLLERCADDKSAILEVQPTIFGDSHSSIGNVAVKLRLLANVGKDKLNP